MPGPNTNATVPLLVRHLLYSGSVAAAIEGTRDLGELLQSWFQQAVTFVAEIQDKDFEIVRKRAILNYLNAQLDEEVVTIGAEARAADRRNPQSSIYKRLFPTKTPSEIVKPTGIGMATELDDCRNLLQAAAAVPDQPDLQTLKSMLSALENLVNACDQALTGVKAALSAQRTVRLRIPEFRDQVRRQFDAFKGELLKRFPGRHEFIESFFLPADLQKPAPEEPQPEPPPVA